MVNLSRRLAAEGAGSLVLAATVVGSGIMATNLTPDVGLALLVNALATGAILVVLIALLAPISGAHLNPAVTLVFALWGKLHAADAVAYAFAQVAGAAAGVLLAHAMFGVPLLEMSGTIRSGAGQWLAEAVATFGLVSVILVGMKSRPDGLPWLVGLYIAAAYWFTSSTSFANPALTIARSLTASFAGIRPIDVPAFIAAQLVAALLAAFAARWFLKD